MLLAALGMAADLDFLLGAHRTYTHTLGACVLILLASMAIAPPSEPRLLTGAACGAAYTSHLLLDWLGSDTSVPIGIMALWPFSSQFYESPIHLFLSTERRYWMPHFWSVNLTAGIRELSILIPLAAMAYWIRRRKA